MIINITMMLIIMMGLMGALWGSSILFDSALGTRPGGFGKGILMVIIGGSLTAGGVCMPGIAEDTNGSPSSDEPSTEPSTPAPASPSPSTQPEETQSPAAEPDPIVLPEIQNGQTIVIALAILAIVIIGGLIALRLIASHRRTARQEHERRAAIEAEKKTALANWQEFVDLHETLRAKALDAETNWDVLFFYPAINDPSEPTTRRMLTALDLARKTSAVPPANLSLDSDIPAMSYPKAVTAFELAWNNAWAHAKKTKQSSLTREERKTVNLIMRTLKQAQGTTSEAEKELCFSRIDKLISQLTTVRVPEQAKQLLAEERRQAITAAVTPTTIS